jgi:uncharacterized ferritin-like protein (DUF455 family)
MKNLFDASYGCIMVNEPTEKVALTRITAQAWKDGQLNLNTNDCPIKTILTPGQPTNLRLVSPKEVPRRTTLSTKKGQIALLHALAHIEFNAINLAWDAVYRFRDLPKAFYDDWVTVADEEANHFSLLHEQLEKLTFSYGDLPAHNGLWEMAVKTADDVLVRMALVPRVLEARGLDATPPIIAKLQAQGLQNLVNLLEIILRDEIGHVATGSRWFAYACAAKNLEPETTYQRLVAQYFTGQIKPPFNKKARLAAGFSETELENLTNLN